MRKTTSMTVAMLGWTATLAASHSAFGQSSVSLRGVIDAGVTYVNNQHGGTAALFDSGILTPNTLTLSGSEDLGSGNKAVFELTSQFDAGSGMTIPGAGQIFNRTAYVGLSNDRFGTLTFGNQYDFMFETLALGRFDGALLFGGLYDFRQGPFTALGVPDNPTGSFDFDRMAGATRVPDSVKYRSPNISGLTFGALYGFGGVPGSLSANSTISFGANYERGSLGVGAAYVEVKYPQLGNGQYKAGALWRVSGPWAWGLDYQYMKGNEILENNQAHQVATALQYNFSKRTVAYVEAVYQRASGDGPITRAWINGLNQPDGAAGNRSQTLARIGLQTKF